jgi:hypothetical protein
VTGMILGRLCATTKAIDMLQRFEKYNPVRSRCWRFDRVLELIENQPFPRRPSRVHDDPYIRGYYNFLLENRCTDWKNSDRTSSDQELALVQAHLLRWSLDAEDRAIVEARLLARETDAEIARKCGILPKAVAWYEGLFFCVRDRLQCSSWIAGTIRGMAGQLPLYGTNSLTEQQRHTVYRLFGYHGGSDILDAMIGAISPRPRPLKAEDCPAWLDDALRIKIRSTAMMAIGRFNKTNVHLLFRAHQNLIKQDSSNCTSAESVEKNIAALVENLGWS